MDATFDTEINGAFAVHQDDLDKLHKLLSSRVGEVKVFLNCSDGVRRTPNSWADFKSYENSERKDIVEMSIRSRSGDLDKSVDVEFSRDGLAPVRLRIACPDDEFSNLKDDIVDILEGMKHKFLSRLFVFDYFKYFMLTTITIGTIALMLLLFFGSDVTNGSAISISPFYGVLTIVYGLIWSTICIIGVTKIRAKYLPTVYFAIGQGAKRYENWKSRWLIALTVVGVAIGVIVTLAIVIV